MDIEELKAYIEEKNIVLPHVKAVVNTLDADWSHIVSMFEIQVPSIRKVDAYFHDDANVTAKILENMGIDLVVACRQTIGMKNRIDTLTTVPLMMTMNQMNLAQVEFRGGEPPGFHMGQVELESNNNGFNVTEAEDFVQDWEREKDEEGYAIIPVSNYQTSRTNDLSIIICSGLPIFKDEDKEILEKEYGMNDIISVTPDAANLAHICAGALDIKMVQHKDVKKPTLVYHKFGDTKQFALPKPYIENTLTTSTISRCRLTFDLPTMSKESMVHEVATYLTAHKEQLSIIPRSPIESIDYKDGYKGKRFVDYPLPMLENMWEKVRSMASRYLVLLKNQDTGFASLNAPLKWSPVLAYMRGESPYYKDGKEICSSSTYDRNFPAVMYGAAGGRMDAMMRSYFSRCRNLDITPFQTVSKKMDEEELKRLKVPRWDYGDITAYERGEEGYFISDVYMKPWGATGGNALMSKFIAGLMKGCIVSGNDVRKFGSTKRLRLAAKMMLPTKANLVEFKGTYPFVLAITSRPTTSEVILIKMFDWESSEYKSHASTVKCLMKQFGDKSMENRFLVIRNMNEFEHVIKVKLASQLSEVFMHLDKLTTDWTQPITSARSRKWFLAGPQIPNLYRTIKINLAAGCNAWSFDPVMSSLLKMDLEGYSMGYEEREEEEEVKEILVVENKVRVKPIENEPVGKVQVKKFDLNSVEF
jgi:hypothetical protein